MIHSATCFDTHGILHQADIQNILAKCKYIILWKRDLTAYKYCYRYSFLYTQIRIKIVVAIAIKN